MHSALMQEIVDLRRRDTEVSVPAFRRHRIRSVPGAEEAPPKELCPEVGQGSVPWADPGDTMAQATAIQVRLREAIVRRNLRKDRTEMRGCADVEWARATGLSMKRIGRGVLRIEGAGPARISLGIDGSSFTCLVPAGASPAAVVAERLSRHYLVEIIEESSDSALVVLTGFAPHT